MTATEKPNTLHYGDCLEILQRMDAESVDLIYLDPPFNSKSNYNMLFGSTTDEDQAQVQALSNCWPTICRKCPHTFHPSSKPNIPTLISDRQNCSTGVTQVL